MLNYSSFLGNRSIITLCKHPTSVSNCDRFSTATDRQQAELAWRAWFSNHNKKRRRKMKRLEKWFSFWWPSSSILQQNNESTSTHLQCLLREFAVSLPIIDTRRRTTAIMESLRWHQSRKWMISPCFSFFGAESPCNKTQRCRAGLPRHAHQPLVKGV